ncbi:MAG: DUF885 domain-containing protein [Acidobacteriota bacterium]|nr:DUF885 domain-containing protein [Acidobacteriota bacterium]
MLRALPAALSLAACISFGCVVDARPASADALDELSRDFWTWRVVHQPSTGDDIPRVERPAGWLPDWSPASIDARRRALGEFDRRWRAIDSSRWPVPRQVDYRLVGSAIARVRWELDGAPAFRRDPQFYIQQALGPVFDMLLQPPPFTAARADAIVERLSHVPRVTEWARANLNDARQPFATLAIDTLDGIEARLATMGSALGPNLPASHRGLVDQTATAAGRALAEYRGWLQSRLAAMPVATAVGRESYVAFLRDVALVPFTPEELLAMGRQEWERAVAFEALEQQRNRALPPMPLFPDQAAHIAKSARDEEAIRAFLESNDLLTVPARTRHYLNLPLPDYLAPVAFLGVTDDLTSETRLEDNGYSYIRVPGPNLPYFYLSTARDPRPIIVHEGVPGHYLQLTLSWAHENPVRRRYYDSGANEGIGFYAEEMMLQAGLWADSPRSREIIYNFARLRALRVEVDVRLATGAFSIEQAADYLEKTVPMDRTTALEEAAAFAAGPGQAITYQIGKLQIIRMLADARRQQGSAFSLRAFHDFVWKNGNVPLSLQRWELLGDRSDVARLPALR